MCDIHIIYETMQKLHVEVLREHRPPPNASIHVIELLNDFCNAN